MLFLKSFLLFSLATFLFIACSEVPLGGSVSLNKEDNIIEVDKKNGVSKEEPVCNCPHMMRTLDNSSYEEGSSK